jgi:hypothetical protein
MQTADSSIVNGKSKPGMEILGIGVLLMVATGFFYPMLFDGKVIFYRDYNLITYPIRYFLGQTFNQGAIPFWVPHANGGLPFMASFHPGVFYPPSFIFFLDDTTYALNLFYVLHFMILGIFAYLLARSWNLSFAAALCCGITGMLSGFIMASVLVSNFFISAVWLPMVFWVFHKFWTEKHIGYFVGLVLTIATQTLAACPEISIMTMLLLYAHSLYFLPRAPGFSGFARMTVSLGLAVVLALCLSALQLIPTAKMIKHTFRDGGLSYEKHTQWSMGLEKLLSMVMSPDYEGYFDKPLSPMADPDASGHRPDDKISSETEADSAGLTNPIPQNTSPQNFGLLHTFYMGLVSLFFVLFGFLFRREKVMGFWLVVFLFGIFLAFGKHNPFYPIIYYGIPFLKLFRYPEKYIFLSAFAAVFLTGFGLDRMIRSTRERQIKFFPVLAILIVLFGVIGLRGMGKSYLSPEYSMGLLAVFGFAFVMFYFGKIKESAFVVLVLAVILLDLSFKGAKLLPLIDRKYYEEKPMLMDILDQSFGKYRIYSGYLDQQPQPLMYPKGPTRLAQIIASKELLIPYAGMVYGLEHVNGYAGLALTLKNNVIWMQVFAKSPPERRRLILMRSNVKYWIDGDRPTPYSEGYPVIFPDRLKVLNGALPRAYLVPKLRLPEEDNHLLNVYYGKSFDPYKEVLLNEKVDFEESNHFSGKVEQVTYKSNHVTVQTTQEGNGFLVLMDSYFPGWTVKVDGQERPILKANFFYRAVQLGPGEHTLEFDYFPEGMKMGLIVSGFSLLLIISGSLFLRKNMKRFVWNEENTVL